MVDSGGNVKIETAKYLTSKLGVDRFLELDNAILKYLFTYLQSGACTCGDDALLQLSEILPSWGVCSLDECNEVCRELGLIAAKFNTSKEEKEQNEQLLKEQRERLSHIRSTLPEKSAESFVHSVVRSRLAAPRHILQKVVFFFKKRFFF
jgi:hypothetical protein